MLSQPNQRSYKTARFHDTLSNKTKNKKKMKLFGFLLGSTIGGVIPECTQVCTGTANNWQNYQTKGITQNGKI